MMNAFPWLFKAKSSWACLWEKKNKARGAIRQIDVAVFYLEDIAVEYFR